MVQPPSIPVPASAKSPTAEGLGADPEFAPMMAECSAMFDKIWALDLAEYKAAWQSAPGGLRPEAPGLDKIDVRLERAPVSDGTELEIQIYSPKDVGDKVLPLMYVMHGGGWTIGSHSVEEGMNRNVCVRNQMRVISVDYRLYVAPSSRSPQIHSWIGHMCSTAVCE